MRTTNYNKQSTVNNSGIEEMKPLLAFFHAIDYKGEHCRLCGHPWTASGELHYHHCKFFTPRVVHKRHHH